MKYFIDVKNLELEDIAQAIRDEERIRFVSFVAVDMGNNHTDEKIPVEHFLSSLEDILENGIQTDGSSVVLPKISAIHDARVDLIPDRNVRWFIDYSKIKPYHNLDGKEELIGTLLIPSFIYRENEKVGSRAVLERATHILEEKIKQMFANHPSYFEALGIHGIKKVHLNLATELEFWVESLQVTKDEESLFISQELKESYWKRPIGELRHAMEECLIIMENYGLHPEMAHKEVGGIGSKLDGEQHYSHMEQIEIDWYYNDALQAVDNELIIKDLVIDVFNRYGLDVTFQAKPIEGVAGSGEHHHFSVTVEDENGKIHNLFAPENLEEDYLSPLGYGAVMGVLKHYNSMHPFISNNIDALNRLKPGFEAPVSTVCSLGSSTDNPSRNRSVLLCLVRDLGKALAYRFEMRSPNPSSNSYMLSAAVVASILDGMAYAIDKDGKALEKELSKESGEEASYLLSDRQYREEKDIFSLYSDEERKERFGPVAASVYDIITLFHDSEKEVLTANGIFTEEILDSYLHYVEENWLLEIRGRLVPEEQAILRKIKKLHTDENGCSYDDEKWEAILNTKKALIQSCQEKKSVIRQLQEAIFAEDLEQVSSLQLELTEQCSQIKHEYIDYKNNLLELD